jgi:hypothetical protein
MLGSNKKDAKLKETANIEDPGATTGGESMARAIKEATLETVLKENESNNGGTK